MSGRSICKGIVCGGSLGWVAGCGCWSEVGEVEGREEGMLGWRDACAWDDCAVCGCIEDKKRGKVLG